MPDTERFNEPNPEISALAEATVPAAAMLVKGFWEAAARLPQPEDFDNADLGALWEAILAVHAKAPAKPIAKTAVVGMLREAGWDDRKAFAALSRAEATYVTLEDATAAIEELHRRKLRRQLTRVLKDTLTDLPRVQNVQELAHRHERAIQDLASQSDGADAWVKGVDVHQETTERLSTGLDDLDRVNGGLPIGELTIAAGRPGMGKSAFGGKLLHSCATQGYGAGGNSLEMPTLAQIHRMAACEAYQGGRLDGGRTANPFYDDYEQGNLSGEQLKRFEAAKAIVRNMPILWDDKRGRTIGQIKLGARRLKTRMEQMGVPLKLLVVDHIGKIRPDRYSGSRHLDLGDITEELACIASELKIAVVGLCQINRGVEQRDDKRPQLSDLRESGRIEEDAHTIMLLYRPAYYDERAKDRGEEPDEKEQRRIARERFVIEVDFAKNRGGPIRRVPLFCEIGANAILSKDDPRCATNAMGGGLV